MRFAATLLIALLFIRPASASEDQTAPVLELPKIVITANPDTEFFTVSWKTKSYLPFAKIKRAWFSRITAGGPADLAGVKVGDELVELDDIVVTTMSGLSLKMNSLRPRHYGTRETIVFRNARGETRKVEFVYERRNKPPAAPTAPAP